MQLQTFLYLCAVFRVLKSDEQVCKPINDKSLVLKQVVILSRHGLRSPLSKYLRQMTPRKWPSWNVRPGFLTAKGAVLEGYMGQYFGAWFQEKGLLQNECPSESMFYVYANTKQRTRASAKAFATKAFPNCNITIHHSDTDVDPLFNPIIHNPSSTFIQQAIEDMQKSLKRLALNTSYEYLENILDYRNSELCKTDKKCDLLTDKNKAIVLTGQKPNVNGPIKIGNSVVDAFVMQFYEGLSLDNVAWSFLQSSTDWQLLMNLSRGYHNVIFNTARVAHDISEPLIKYMRRIFFNDSVPKVTLLMGHDANMYTILKTLRFRLYTLPNQYELCPIGGKLVFQKWYDEINKEDLLKIDFVYQSSYQLRNATVLSLNVKPQFKLMELEDCKVDGNGFCLWEDFKKILDGE